MMRLFSLAIVALLTGCLASPAFAQSANGTGQSSSQQWGLRLLVVTMATDAGSTLYGLQTGQVHEANPAMAWTQRHPAVFITVKGGGSAVLWTAVRHVNKPALTWSLVGWYAAVTAWNIHQIQIATRNKAVA